MLRRIAFRARIGFIACITIACVLLLGASLQAQDTPPTETPTAVETPTPIPDPSLAIELVAPDGKTLHGSYFARSQDPSRAVLLLHQLYADRSSWTPLIYPLLDAGFKVLAVDLRGYGQSRAKINWTAAQEDTLAWAAWLREQPGVASVGFVGSSMGASLALVGCGALWATDASQCVGAVALSPGLNYFNVYTGDAVKVGFPTLVIYAEDDRYPKVDVPELQTLSGDALSVIVYPGRRHGVDLFKQDDLLATTLVAWLAER
ncbi:MAG: alpha/beta fold hydrolase [Armatimonadetes bacterium]|nr:alpha/beta fold hydrolase [Anaerolineae bacterium]